MSRDLRLLVIVACLALPVPGAHGEYGDMVFKREGPPTGVPVAVFPHYVHRMQFKCFVCHESVFAMKAGANPGITMEAIQAGKFCGKCHDGKTAFQSTFNTCPRCHLE